MREREEYVHSIIRTEFFFTFEIMVAWYMCMYVCVCVSLQMGYIDAAARRSSKSRRSTVSLSAETTMSS